MNTKNQSLETSDPSRRTAAIIGGIGLLLMAVLAAYANFGVLQSLIIPGDAQTTAENILASSGSFRLAIISLGIVAILDVIVAWALYIILKPANKSLALIAAWLRIIYAFIFGFALTKLFGALQLLTSLDPSQFTAPFFGQAMSRIEAFQTGWDAELILFGLHLLALAVISFKFGPIPKWLGALLGLAGLGYLVDSMGAFLLPNLGISVGKYTFFGELILIFWLFWKGIKGFSQQQTVSE